MLVALCFVACHKWAIPIVCAQFIIRNSRCKRLQIADTVLLWLRIKLFKNFAYGCLQGHLPVELQQNFVLRWKNDSEYAYCISVYFQPSFYPIHPSGARWWSIDIIWRGARRLYFVTPWNQPEVGMPLSYLKLAQTALICVGVFIQHWQYAHSLLQLFLMATSAQWGKKGLRGYPNVVVVISHRSLYDSGSTTRKDFVFIKLLYQVEKPRRKYSLLDNLCWF